MGIMKPLVLGNNNEITELQPGDTIGVIEGVRDYLLEKIESLDDGATFKDLADALRAEIVEEALKKSFAEVQPKVKLAAESTPVEDVLKDDGDLS